MKMDDFAASMRAREVTSNLRLDEGTWTVVRVDGRGFSRLTATHFDKPFDARFSEAMVSTARGLMEEMQGLLAYTQSDEISLVLPPHFDAFDRRIEKIVSVAAGFCSAVLTHAIGTPAHFDGRVWQGTGVGEVAEYMRWRQSDALRCSLAGWCYWTLRNSGCSVLAATRALERLSLADKHALLRDHAVNPDDIPAWQRRGVLIHWSDYTKEGFDPIRQESVQVKRRRIDVNREIPVGDELQTMVERTLDIRRSVPPLSELSM